MKNLARAAATLGIAVAIGVVTAPSASAAEKPGGEKDKRAAAAEKKSAQPNDPSVYYVSGDARLVREHGPGNLVVVPDVNSEGVPVDLRLQNESVTTGDVRPGPKNKSKNSPVTFQIEGSEQDTGEKS